MTYYDLLRSSLRLIQVLGPGRGPNTSEIIDAMFVLNSMLDSWSTEHLTIYTINRNAYPLLGRSQITFGSPGGDYPDRPLQIDSAAVTYSAGYESPIEVLTRKRWIAGGGPTLPGGYAGVYNDNAFPVATIYVRPVPSNATDLVLYTWQVLKQVSDENQTVMFPQGYADAIRYNLAVRIAPEWGREPRPDVIQLALNSLANIKRKNMEPIESSGTDGGALGCGCGGAYNIYTDTWH